MKYLLDTNIVSELYKLERSVIDPNVRKWLSSIKPSETAISCVTLSEIQTGILLKERRDLAQAALLTDWFETRLIPLYQDRTLDITKAIALQAAKLHIPNKMNINDAYIGATAMQHNLILVTRNIKDFAKLDLELFNPFDIT